MTEKTLPESLEGISIPDYLALLPDGMGELNRTMGVEIVELTKERVVCTMPVEGNRQPMRLLHGGASVVLAETVGSIGGSLHALPLGLAAVGVDINATHHRGVTSGLLTAVGTAIHLGRTSAAYEIVITDERGKRVCTSRITLALVPIS